MNYFSTLFSSEGFMPHGHCYLWTKSLLYMHVVSDLLIGLSYVAISAMLVGFVHRARRDIPFQWMFLAFGTFIIACGGTHFMEVWNTWVPRYWESGAVKILTAGASVLTALALPPLIPVALGMIQAAKLSEQRREQLENQNNELTHLYDRLKEFDELKTQFFANVSHELRTPLALVLGPAERMIAEGGLEADQRRDLETISRNARTLLKNVNDLLDVSKLEAGKMVVSYTEADLSRIVRVTASHFQSIADERRIDFVVEAPEALSAQVDPEKIQRALLNLLSNAFKFCPVGGTVRCTLAASDSGGEGAPSEGGEARYVVLSVADSGPGVPTELRDAIFERFRQGEGGVTRRFGGTGLGLAITKDFVELHRGEIAVGEAPKGGALFTVTLPRIAPAGTHIDPSQYVTTEAFDDVIQQHLQELKTVAAPADLSDGEPDRALVLVVEDNREMSRFITETLAPQYRTEVAEDGRAGLEKALQLQPDLILSDIMMPVMSGDQLVREIRSRPELDPIPLVMLTARTDDDLRVNLLREGAQDYLVKPFSVEELRARVKNLIEMKRARQVLQRELETSFQDLETLTREVSHRKRELQTALDSMRVARERAEQASLVKSNFLRLVSHELRTPLNALQLQLHVLERDRGSLTPKQTETLDRMNRSSSRLVELIEGLLQYARIESGGLTVQIAPFDLATLGEEVLDELRPQAEQKGLSLEMPAIAERSMIESDPKLLRLVLVNLVGNALKFTEDGTVALSFDRDEGDYSITVRDTGAGIPPEQQKQIFEPFEQLEPVRQKHTPGVGLGLTIVRDIVAALGGRIEVESEPGKGSAFVVRLPAALSTESLAQAMPDAENPDLT